MANQWALPASDSSAGQWTNELGTNTNLFESVNEAETSADDVDYLESDAATDDDTCILGLSSIDAPGPGTVKIKIRGKKGAASGGGYEVAFVWAATEDADRYTLQVGTSAGSSDKYNASVGNVLTYHLMLPADTYYSRVLAYQGASLLETKDEQSITVPV